MVNHTPAPVLYDDKTIVILDFHTHDSVRFLTVCLTPLFEQGSQARKFNIGLARAHTNNRLRVSVHVGLARAHTDNRLRVSVHVGLARAHTNNRLRVGVRALSNAIELALMWPAVFWTIDLQ